MPRADHSRTSREPRQPSPVERLRARYYRHPPRNRLLAGAAIVVAVAVLAFLLGISVLAAASVALASLLVFAALMRSTEAVATTSVSLVWLCLAFVLFQIPIPTADSAVLLLLPLVPLSVSVVATRIAEFPVWHTTLLALLVGLIVGLAVALAGMLTSVFPPALGLVCTAVASGAALGWRFIAAYRLRRGMHNRDSTASQQPDGSNRRPRLRAGSTAPTRGANSSSAANTSGGRDETPDVSADEALAELENMIGLEPVKQEVRALAASIEAARLRADAGYSVERPLRHLVFSGPPGTGKTSVARTLARVFHAFGLLPSSRVVEAQRADLVGEYLGATAIKTNQLIDSALGGVLFIDEAYSLVNDGDGQPDRFGNEAVQTLLKRAEDDRNGMVIILAGYRDEMEHFLASNPGLASRFDTRVTFPSFSAAELQRIAESLLEQRGEAIAEEAQPALQRRFEQAQQREVIDELGNGRFARSLVEKAAEARDVRVVTAQQGSNLPDTGELVTVRATDVTSAFTELTRRLSGFAEPPDVEEALAELDDMIGLEPVKRQVRSIVAQLQVAKLREEQGLRNQPPMRHFVFTGPPGTGKTSVARVLGRVFAALGLLSRPDVVEAQRLDLVGEHLGATAIKTGKLVDRALGGVLFVDEAYSLDNPGYSGGDAFGAEAVQTLLKRAEDDRSRLVVVLAGYPAEMDRFLASNSGLSSRFNIRVGFPSYAPDELTEIADSVAENAGDVFEEEARADLRRVFDYVCSAGWIDELGNGRFVRSLFEKACAYRDLRVSQDYGNSATAAELTVVTRQDVRNAYTEVTQG